MEKDDDAKIDLIFDEVDRLYEARGFEAVNEALQKIDVESLEVPLLIAWLGITLSAKEHLPYREKFVKRTREHLQKVEPERVDRLLERLE